MGHPTSLSGVLSGHSAALVSKDQMNEDGIDNVGSFLTDLVVDGQTIVISTDQSYANVIVSNGGSLTIESDSSVSWYQG